LIFLRQRDADNCAFIQSRKFKTILLRTEHLADLGIGEVIEIIVDGRNDAAELLCRLMQEAVQEMIVTFSSIRIAFIP